MLTSKGIEDVLHARYKRLRRLDASHRPNELYSIFTIQIQHCPINLMTEKETTDNKEFIRV